MIKYALMDYDLEHQRSIRTSNKQKTFTSNIVILVLGTSPEQIVFIYILLDALEVINPTKLTQHSVVGNIDQTNSPVIHLRTSPSSELEIPCPHNT
ncbi:hypothetical protein BRADI_1g08665v3 [Brachypodium distachyon]|uniref:Uncharacterized protein n=1 Tax=Brachypodium distachyon TaxID=15368 RepID=A0A2K2DIN0_BRADI|nr:hypothetical protein BRADI_1g08665v3 [Brachypodium distachyon]